MLMCCMCQSSNFRLGMPCVCFRASTLTQPMCLLAFHHPTLPVPSLVSSQVHLLVHEESGIVIPQELVDMTRVRRDWKVDSFRTM